MQMKTGNHSKISEGLLGKVEIKTRIINYREISENLGCHSKIPLTNSAKGPFFDKKLFDAPKAFIWEGEVIFFSGDGKTWKADVKDFLSNSMGPAKTNASIIPQVCNIFSPDGEKFIQSSPANTHLGNGRFLIFNQSGAEGVLGMFFKQENGAYTANLLWAGFPPGDKILSYQISTLHRHTTIKKIVLTSEAGRSILISTGDKPIILNNGHTLPESVKSKATF